MSHKSCLTSLLEFLEFVSKYVDQGVPVDTKLFNCVGSPDDIACLRNDLCK